MSNFNNDEFRAEYKRPILPLYLFSSNVSCNLQQQSDFGPDTSQGSDLHSSVPDALTPFLDLIHEEGLFLFMLAQTESTCLCNSGGNINEILFFYLLKFDVVTSKGGWGGSPFP